MRFQFRSDVVDTLLKETLRILILIGIVGCPFSGTQRETKAMEMTQYTAAATPAIDDAMAMAQADTALSTAAAAVAATLANANAVHRATSSVEFRAAVGGATPAYLRVAAAKDYPLIATMATDTYAISSSASDTASGWQLDSESSAASDYSAPVSSLLALHRISKDTHNTYSLPTSENSNDSNEIDSLDYIMTKHIASHTMLPRINKPTAEDLSSLSLLSANNDTTATSSPSASSLSSLSSSSSLVSVSALATEAAAAPGAPTLVHKLSESPSRRAPSDRGSSGNHTVTFQHLGSQRIALKSTAKTKTTTAGLSPTAAATAGGGTKHTNTRTSANKVESKYILPKPQKTDAPMLNYIFDTFSSANKHHHHDQRYGPHFEDVQRVGQPTNLTVQAGSSIHLNCRISLLQDKTVSWVRRNAQGENALDLLTVGLHTYTGDKRYKMEFQYPNNWRLRIINVKKDDEAMYECQISTHPPRVIQINLLVNAPKVMIVDEFGDPLQEKYYEIDSTLQLSCVVRNVAMATSVVYWKHAEDVLNYDVTRGGISVKTELMDDGANSTLFIAKINKSDSGNYTCSISDFQNFSIVVHILNGESFAELHHGGAAPAVHTTFHHTLAIHLISLALLLLCLPTNNIHR